MMLGKYTEALSDAREAVRLDKSFVKVGPRVSFSLSVMVFYFCDSLSDVLYHRHAFVSFVNIYCDTRRYFVI